MLDLWSSRRTVFVETGSSRWIFSSTVTSAAVLLWFLDTVLFKGWGFLSLRFGFQSLFLLADDVFPWFVYAIITLETTAMDTSNKVAVPVTDAPGKHTPTICSLWKFGRSRWHLPLKPGRLIILRLRLIILLVYCSSYWRWWKNCWKDISGVRFLDYVPYTNTNCLPTSEVHWNRTASCDHTYWESSEKQGSYTWSFPRDQGSFW